MALKKIMAVVLWMTLGSIIGIPISAKKMTKEFNFSGSTANFATDKEFTTDGTDTWKVTGTSGMTSVKPSTLQEKEGYPDPMGISIPSKGYLRLMTEMTWSGKIISVELYGWSNNSTTGRLTCDISQGNAAGLAIKQFAKKDFFANPDTWPVHFSANNYEVKENDWLRIYFDNTWSSAYRVFISKIVVNYDDGEELSFAYTADGEAVESGCSLPVGSVLSVNCPQTEDAKILYKAEGSSLDDWFPAEGLTLDTPGRFVYHFEATAEGYDSISDDFEVTVTAEESENTAYIIADDFIPEGLKIFEADSEDYETLSSWIVKDIKFSFEPGNNLRLENVADVAHLMIAPGSALRMATVEGEQKILSLDLEGVNTDNLEISAEIPQAVGMKRTASWSGNIERGGALIISNAGAEPAGIRSFNVALDTDTETGIEIVNADTDAPAVYYDLTGRPVTSPERGVYIERRGNTSRLIVR